MARSNEAICQEPLSWVPVLMYHRVVDATSASDPYFLEITTAHFAEQMAYLRNHGYQPIRLADVPVAAGPHSTWSRPVAITFDDGYQDTLTHALPIMQQFGMTGTVMLVSDRIGGTNDWDVGKAGIAQLLSLNEIRTFQQSGGFIGAHTATHASLADLPQHIVRDELIGGKAKLENLCGVEVSTLAYPYGRSTPVVREIVEEAGYVAAFGVDQNECSVFNFSRIDGARHRGATQVWQLKLSGLYHRLRQHPGLKLLNQVRLQLTA